MNLISPNARSTVAPADLEARREAVIGALGVHFASDDLSMSALERRLEIAVRARSVEELDALVVDLPAGVGPQQHVAQDEVPARTVVAAFMGGNVRRGTWLVPRHVKVFAVMGGVELDLRQARFGPGLTEIEVFALMGGVDVIVPPDVRVETMGMAVMGGFETRSADVAAHPDAPLVRITGIAVMGGVEARVKIPREKRLRAFQHKLARLRGG